jgi:hypothetical protein
MLFDGYIIDAFDSCLFLHIKCLHILIILTLSYCFTFFSMAHPQYPLLDPYYDKDH